MPNPFHSQRNETEEAALLHAKEALTHIDELLGNEHFQWFQGVIDRLVRNARTAALNPENEHCRTWAHLHRELSRLHGDAALGIKGWLETQRDLHVERIAAAAQK